jgi:hypothetical protein|tara:strand:+ start:282 stop:482 length:201 start_codon:yes stop_codon:yes gene_type:complete
MFNLVSKFVNFFTKPTSNDEYIVNKWKKEQKERELPRFSTDKEAGFVDTTLGPSNKGLTKVKQNAN